MGYSGGFESNWVGPDVLSVEVRGNGFTSDVVVREYSLLQAAEKARETGFTHFTMLDVEDKGKTNTYFDTTNGEVSAQSIYKPSRGIVVRMYEDIPSGFHQSQYFVVSEVLSTLGAKHIK